ncbi:MAG: MgtC/SapB family protein, partial [Clostridia bacterium]|nr:MgtC/SapB family protein [Clostridia bacterium]
MPYDIQLTIALRLILAFLFGLIIGWERTSQQKPAGSRTHGLVCLASALFMIISTYGFLDFPGQKDPARLAAQVVTGMGFIGAGAIWREGSWVRGLTTASTLWVSSALGLALGIGLYIPATVTLILAYCTLQLYTLKKILTGRDEWLERVQVYEALDLESLKIALEELFSCPIHVSTFSASDL